MQVMLIGADGVRIGVLDESVARRLARESNLTLTIVSKDSNPMVARLVDSGRMKYEENRKRKQSRRASAAATDMKNIRFGVDIDDNDLRTKLHHVQEFIDKGIRVQVDVIMKGRRQSRPEDAMALVERITSSVHDSISTTPRRNGRSISLMLTPHHHKG